MRESVSTTKLEASLPFATRTAAGDANGTAVRINDCEEVAFVGFIGSWVDGSHVLQPQYATTDPADSSQPDAGSWADIPAADLVGDVPTIDDATDDDSQVQLAFKKHGDWEWVRLRHEITGGATGLGLGGFVRKTRLRHSGIHPDSALGHQGAHAE